MAARRAADLVPPTGTRHVLLQCTKAIGPFERAAFSQAGVDLVGSLRTDLFLASLTARGVSTKALQAMDGLADVRPVRRSWKLHPFLRTGKRPVWAIVKGDASALDPTVGVYVLLYSDVALDPDGRAAVAR
ncbi:MAG: hypothetical protein ACE5EX_10810, partial [Phycisphaerae bacterium]